MLLFSDDTYAQESIDLLTNSGIDFKKHQEHGIDVVEFGELLISSGLILMDNVTWISFHSGYDFGYLLKVLTGNPMSADEGEFLKILQIFFPRFFDIKYLMKSCKTLKGGLQDVADDLGVSRVGIKHQAGSDSHLTCMAFFRLKQVHFDGQLDEKKYMNRLYGIGASATSNPFALNSNDSSLLVTGSTVTNMITTESSVTSNNYPTTLPAPDPNSILLGTPLSKKKI